MRLTTLWIFVLTLTVFVCPPAMADGIHTVAYFTRIGISEDSIISIVGKVALLMLANYALNLVVIGFPAIKFGAVNGRRVAIGLVGLTLLGQIADRLGALVAGMLAGPVAGILGLSGEGFWFWPLIGLNFFFSGIAVGVLAFYFLRRRWRVGKGLSWAIAGTAAILTNPAWAMCLWFIYS